MYPWEGKEEAAEPVGAHGALAMLPNTSYRVVEMTLTPEIAESNGRKNNGGIELYV